MQSTIGLLSSLAVEDLVKSGEVKKIEPEEGEEIMYLKIKDDES